MPTVTAADGKNAAAPDIFSLMEGPKRPSFQEQPSVQTLSIEVFLRAQFQIVIRILLVTVAQQQAGGKIISTQYICKGLAFFQGPFIIASAHLEPPFLSWPTITFF